MIESEKKREQFLHLLYEALSKYYCFSRITSKFISRIKCYLSAGVIAGCLSLIIELVAQAGSSKKPFFKLINPGFYICHRILTNLQNMLSKAEGKNKVIELSEWFFSRFLRRNLRHKLTYAKTFWGLPIICFALDAYMYRYGILDRRQEYKLTKFFIKIFQQDDIFFDIGAYFGFYSLLANEFVKEIHCFEPSPYTLQILKTNVKGKDKIICNEYAISNHTGDADFFVSTTRPDISSFNVSVNHLLIHNVQFYKQKVKTIRLDDYVENTGVVPTILKIDVEGHEKQVIEGGINIFKKYSPIIALEIWNTKSHIQAVEMLYSLGYESFIITPDGGLIKQYPLKPEFVLPKGGGFDNVCFMKTSRLFKFP